MPAHLRSQIQRWIESMAPYIKSRAPRQLVTLSSEGFYGPGSGKEGLNPGSWAAPEVSAPFRKCTIADGRGIF